MYVYRRRDIVVRIIVLDLIVYYFSFFFRLYILEVFSFVLCGIKIIFVCFNLFIYFILIIFVIRVK